jgi:hypothetical protein
VAHGIDVAVAAVRSGNVHLDAGNCEWRHELIPEMLQHNANLGDDPRPSQQLNFAICPSMSRPRRPEARDDSQ